jgi:hypothetical protein
MGDCCIHVETLQGPGLIGSDLLLLPDPNQALARPDTYVFPAEGSVLQVGLTQQSSSQLSPAAAAGIAVSAVAAFAMLVLAGLFVVRHVRPRTHAGSSTALNADKSGGYNQLSKRSSGIVDSDNSDRGSSGRNDQNTIPGSAGSGSTQRASSNLPLLTPDQLLMISDQTSVSCQGGVQAGPGFNIVPDWGAASGNADLVIEPVYEPVYGMFEALHGRTGDQVGLQHSTRGQRLTAAINDQVRSIHHTRLTSSMQAGDGHSARSRRGSSRQLGGAGSGGGSASMGAGSSSAGGDAAAAGDVGSAADEEGDVEDGIADLVLHEVIGQGGFGVVYRWAASLVLVRVQWHFADVAVKLPPGSKLAAVTLGLSNRIIWTAEVINCL